MKTQCPKCASHAKDSRKDNLHIYSDGSGYCFSCGYIKKSPITIESIKNRIETKENMAQQVQQPNSSIKYASLTTKIPPNVRLWLAGKGIDPEYRTDSMFWSPETEELVFPVHDANGKIVFSSNRYFGSNVDHPRYINRGLYNDNMLVLGDDKASTVFIVEGYLDALRIASIKNPNQEGGYAAYPMFGCKPPREHMLTLSGKFMGVLYFLDPDKRKDALEIKQQYAHLFEYSDTVFTDADPKDMKHEDLERKLKLSYEFAERKLFDERFSVHDHYRGYSNDS